MTRSGTWWMLAGALWLCGCGANVPTGPTLTGTTPPSEQLTSGLHGIFTGIYTFDGSTAFGTSPMTITLDLTQSTGANVTGTFQIEGAAAAMFADSRGSVKGTLAAVGESNPATF
jgi:hypothetical protein